MKELQIVNHNEFYPMLGMHPAALARSCKMDRPGVSSIYNGALWACRRSGDPLEIVGIEQTVPKVFEIQPRIEQIIRVTSDFAVISKLNTPTSTFSLSVTCSAMFRPEVFPWMAASL